MTVKPTKQSIQKNAPQTVGVYIFFADKTPVYIGKSVHLRARLLSHLESARLDPKEEAVLRETTRIKLILTDSEFKALVLEAALIREKQPKYNRIWRDDKSYLYITIDTREKYPHVRFARRHDLENPKLPTTATAPVTSRTPPTTFGPFPSLRVADRILREVRRVFPYCSQPRVMNRPCFHSKIGLCNPCPSAIEKTTREKDKTAAEKIYRRNIRAIIRILRGGTHPVLSGLYRRLKQLSDKQRYEEALALRNRILAFEKFVSEPSGIERETLEPGAFVPAGESLRELLTRFFPHLPRLARIECYDISNTSRKEATAAMTVATDGTLDKSQYKKFMVREKRARSDFEMIAEILRRRFGNPWPKPDLLVVDGGRPQVRTVLRALTASGAALPVVGIAKNPDRLVIGRRVLGSGQNIASRRPVLTFTTLHPSAHHAGFNLVRLLRDEAHRFSKKYHVHLRSRTMLAR